jgi:hypothetical protein
MDSGDRIVRSRPYGPRIAWVSVVAALSLLGGQSSPDAQSYASGQNISPAFEGWERDADGAEYFLFGYMNRNWEEEIDVPVGADNTLEPGGPDVGQPTHFLPRRNRFVFRVRVPKDFGDKEMIWTLTTKGKTEKAYATLRADYFLDDVTKASETGALGAGTSSPEVRANKPPVIRIDGAKTRIAKVGEPLEIVLTVGDDGVPKRRAQVGAGVQRRSRTDIERIAAGGAAPNPAFNPPSRITVGKTIGLHAALFVYRGDGAVEFEPAQVKVWEDTRTGANSPWAPLWTPPVVPSDGHYVSKVTFNAPGTYILRARADDGALIGDDQVTITVSR